MNILHPSPGAATPLPRDMSRFARLATEPDPVLTDRPTAGFEFISSLQMIAEGGPRPGQGNSFE